MNESRLAESAVSIVINLYTGILQGIPNLLNILTESKESSYYRDKLVKDIRLTDNAVTIAADDRSARAMEIKLQEKGISFITVSSKALDGYVKANGAHIFIISETDYDRAIEGIQEVKNEFAKQNNEIEVEIEEDLELEREKPESTAVDEENEESMDDGDLTEEAKEPEEEPEEESDPKDDKKKSKKKKKTDTKPYPPYDSTYKNKHHDDENKIRDDQARELRNKRETEAREADRNKEAREARERELRKSEDTSREYQPGLETARQDEAQRKNDKKQTPEEDREPSAGQNHRAERSESQTGNADNSLNLKTREFERGKSTQEVLSEGNFIVHPVEDAGFPKDTPVENPSVHGYDNEAHPEKRPSESRQPEGYRTSSGVSPEPERTERTPVDSRDLGRQTQEGPSGYNQEKTGQTAPESQNTGQPHHPERSALASGNKNIENQFGGHHGSEIKGRDGSVSVTILGNGTDLRQDTGYANSPGTRTGTTMSNSPMSNQSESFTARRSNSLQQAYGDEAHKSAAKIPKDIMGPNEVPKTYGKITVQKVNIPAIYNNRLGDGFDLHDELNKAYSLTEQGKADKYITMPNSEVSLNYKNIRQDITKDILNGRRLYQIRDVFSPNNYRGFMAGTKMIVAQSVVGRETEGGRTANEVVDYVSPAAKLAQRKILNGGAIEIARTTHYSVDVMAAAYATKNQVSLNEARSELRQLKNLDSHLLKEGKSGINLTNDGVMLKKLFDASGGVSNSESFISMLRGFDDQKYADFIKNLKVTEELKDELLKIPLKDLTGNDAMLEKLIQAYSDQRNPESFISMIRSFDDRKFVDFLNHLKITDDLQEILIKIPRNDLTAAKVDSLIKKFGGNRQNKELLEMIRAGKLVGQYPGAGNFSSLYRRYFNKLLKQIGRDSDAGRALGTWVTVSRNVYGAYRAGVRLIYTALRKFTNVNLNTIAAQVMAEPVKALGGLAVKKTTGAVGKGAAKLFTNHPRVITKTKRVAQHASSALKFLKNPFSPLKNILSKNALFRKASAVVGKVSGKIALLAAKVGVVLGWIAVIAVIIIILIEVSQSIPGLNDKDDSGVHNYMFAQDTEIVQEVITELTAKNEEFVVNVNNAANHRGNYGTTSGLTANENVGFYESGAYNVVFRDAYGNELEPSHVDLNNTKAILAMATKFMPYPFQKLSENASPDEKKAYEDIKQHFKDYCYFLWASTHQISIEEYHPGNSDGVEGAVDNSGLVTTLDKGKCDQDGKTLWLQGDFIPDVAYGKHCEACDEVPNTQYGTFYDDLCTHGKNENEHGGWKKTGDRRVGVNCRADARGREHHDNCNEDEDNCFTCDLSYYKTGCWHWEYEWVYECGGHMGSVVYITIGDLSRLPGFSAAGDVDYDAVGKYDAGDSIIGSDITTGLGYPSTDDQVALIAALCIMEQGDNLRAVTFEASLLCNLADRDGMSAWDMAHQKWFAEASRDILKGPVPKDGTAISNRGTMTNQILSAVKDVVVNGKRVTRSTEHDSFVDIVKIEKAGSNGANTYTEQADIKNRNNYIAGQTVIYNSYGAKYVFECFPTSTCDPFGIKTGEWK